ncbi:very low-density lipoprotein receptor-like isoform X1 [Eriocheir sinensis]|uniref:very low-density lipoprotein receptor-like isoform X1 n=1 Tax=Eriocheir sinensis TaxID=95602 RepID=UPI0021C8E832|nr:very low-density lipoprotein receptor-like isoform X1 [Eriocheir sinensis]
MPPLRSLVVVLLLAAFLAHSLPQDGPSRNLDFTFADKTRVLASRVSGRDLTRPRRQSSSSRLVDYQGGSGKLEYKDERDMDEPGTDSAGPAFDISERSCPGDNTYTCVSGDTICRVNICDGNRDCPDGDDEQDCECSADKFLCDKTKCIPNTWLCDGDEDCEDKTDEQDCSATCASPKNFTCSDGTCAARCDGNYECLDNADEENCPSTTTTTTPTPPITTTTPAFKCSNDEFLCDNTKCIPKDWLCDGDEDCEDKTDEHDCSGCGAGQWQCRDGGCISEKDRCDGCVHCRDGSDEEGCRPKRCRHWEFRCRDGSCINKRLRCNGRRDCRDGSDEWQCRPHWPWHHGRNRFTEADPNLREEALL